MIANAALVDSSVLISLLRRGLDPAKELMTRARRMDLATCGMVRLEVLRGVVQPATRRAVAGFLDVMCNIPSDNRLWEEAAQLAWELDRRGRTLPAQDILIAACARRIGAVVLSHDAHFSEIPDLTVLTSIDDLN